jgi:hypothetical protein
VAELARLLDDVRPLIVDARQQGERPRFLLLDREAYDAVAACKRTDRERGMPMMVLGMEIVKADQPIPVPRVF